MRTTETAAGTRVSARVAACAAAALLLGHSAPAHAMHIAEGILPPAWAGLWFAVVAPFIWLGLREVRRRSGASPHFKVLTGLVGAAVFVISCTPIPVPFTGTSSHPCGMGLAAVILGPAVTTVIAAIALLLQALFLADGGLTTLGANTVAMGVVGAYAGWLVFRGLRAAGVGVVVAVGAAGLVSDWSTYATTAVQLAAALKSEGTFAATFTAIVAAYLPTQVPIGILEALVSAAALKFLLARRPEFVAELTTGRR
jgi:cobalt/nickel transport system permease protein